MPSSLTCRDCADLSKVQERFQRRMEQKRRASIASESKESSEPGRTHTPSRDFLTTDPNQRAVSASPNLNSRFKKRMGSWIAGMKGFHPACRTLCMTPSLCFHSFLTLHAVFCCVGYVNAVRNKECLLERGDPKEFSFPT
ncbi:hypothetical protein Y032_0015g2847 [Ancylostoma ceylanicum]|uniref:Uncharacterized protein n=1 Tax=Ancylostoma ceylanicum TaxID=53326 RepID=A0A016V8P2_9BILA|nr:hypothetical protein Y032_0015g2847 [Ancylostoma ceylanicum]